MSQGYPQQGRAADPYGGQPYRQPQPPYPQQQYPPAPYQPQYPQQSYPQQYPPAGHGQAPHGGAPPQAGGFRRGLGGLLDFLVAMGPGLAAATREPKLWPVMVLAVPLVLSFANQVLLARLTGCSVGKFLVATRVVRRGDGGRPDTWRLARRWFVAGLLGWAVVVINAVFDSRDGFDAPDDLEGVLIVRRKHLRERLG